MKSSYVTITLLNMYVIFRLDLCRFCILVPGTTAEVPSCISISEHFFSLLRRS